MLGSFRPRISARPSPPLPYRYQARHENERRWLSLDLLDGRVDAKHEWHSRLLRRRHRRRRDRAVRRRRGAAGHARHQPLSDQRALPRPPHPSISLAAAGRERPRHLCRRRGGTGEAARGRKPELRRACAKPGIATGMPIAITEVHHGCHRDEQLRWFAEVWETATQLRAEGMDLRAVTLWSMFGNVDWRFLLTQRNGFYDTGAFDARSGTPRPTVIAQAAKAYAQGRDIRSSGARLRRAGGGGRRASTPGAAMLQAAGLGRPQAADHRRDRHARPAPSRGSARSGPCPSA